MSCSSGGCSSGGCNKMNTFDWFSNIQYASGAEEYNVVELSFKNGSRKEYFVNEKRIDLYKGDMVCVEGNGGYDIGEVSLKGELVKLQLKKKKITKTEEFQKILRKANEKELEIQEQYRQKENKVMILAREIAKELNLDMKISEVEYQADGKKATFYFIANERVDFRELIKRYIAEFKIKIEMKHIGARQEAARIGGIGSCGRELCCSTFLNYFPSVSTQAARYQNLSINIEKLSGQCGRLKCCLNYELAQYIEAVKEIPQNINQLQTEEGLAVLKKTEILKRLMVFVYKDDPTSDYYKISIDNVKKISELNKKGHKPQNLLSMAVKEIKIESEEKDEDLVGQIQLKTLEKKSQQNKNRNKKKKNKNKPPHNNPSTKPQSNNNPK